MLETRWGTRTLEMAVRMQEDIKLNLHSITPVNYFVLVASDFETLAVFLVFDYGDICEPFLA